MNILVYGYGMNEGGYACAMYFYKRGHKVRITDLRDESSLGEGIQKLKKLGIDIVAGAHRVEDFRWADLVIKTPAISPDNPFLEYAKAIQNDFSFLFENENVAKTKLICVTGAKNKTVTTEAVCHALNTMGRKARTCASVDTSVYSELEKWEKSDIPEFLICRMSSWQVRDLDVYSEGCIPEVELAVMTSATVSEKFDVFSNRSRFLLCSLENRQNIKEQLHINMRRVSLIENNLKGFSSDLQENLRTAYAVLKRLGFKSKEINFSLKSFKGVPHRNELVVSNENMLVINDSSTTIPSAVDFSVKNMKNSPIHLICGGSNINLEAEPMLETCKKSASLTLLDGSFTRNRLIPLLDKNGIKYSGPFEKMNDAVNSCLAEAEKNKKMLQVILLCPGASANEFFNNESDRGKQFKNCIKEEFSIENSSKEKMF